MGRYRGIYINCIVLTYIAVRFALGEIQRIQGGQCPQRVLHEYVPGAFGPPMRELEQRTVQPVFDIPWDPLNVNNFAKLV